MKTLLSLTSFSICSWTVLEGCTLTCGLKSSWESSSVLSHRRWAASQPAPDS